MRWRKEKQELVELDAKKVTAARAMYIDENTQRVELTIETSDNYLVRITLTTPQVQQMIEQSTMAFYAIHPPLRTSRNTYGN